MFYMCLLKNEVQKTIGWNVASYFGKPCIYQFSGVKTVHLQLEARPILVISNKNSGVVAFPESQTRSTVFAISEVIPTLDTTICGEVGMGSISIVYVLIIHIYIICVYIYRSTYTCIYI